MKILVLANGASSHTTKWVRGYIRRGHEVHLVFCKDHGLKDDDKIDDCYVHRLKYRSGIGYYLNIFKLKRLFNRINPDVVNVHYASGYGTLARLAKIGPCVLSVWGSDVYDFPYQNKQNMNIIKKNLLHAQQIVSTSQAMASQTSQLANILLSEIKVVPFGVDIDSFSISSERVGQEKIVVGITKHLKKVYGIDVLIEATRILIDSLKSDGFFDVSNSIEIHVYGEGEEKGSLRELIERLNLEDSVILMGRVPPKEIPNILRTFDIFCVTSYRESFGVSLIEAMATGLPVVATRTVGFSEIIENEKDGLLVEVGNPSQVAEALKKIILNKDEAKKLGIRAREKVIYKYEFEDDLDEMIGILEHSVQ